MKMCLFPSSSMHITFMMTPCSFATRLPLSLLEGGWAVVVGSVGLVEQSPLLVFLPCPLVVPLLLGKCFVMGFDGESWPGCKLFVFDRR
jgi:hypothetical protein